LPRLDIGDLVRLKVFPNNWHTRRSYEVSVRWPFLKTLVVSLAAVEATHVSGYTQRIGLRWIRTGFGGNSRPRPLLICRCGRSMRKLYLVGGSLGCRYCHNTVRASQVCGKRTRPVLQAIRLRTFLALKRDMRQTNRQRLKARLASKPTTSTLNSKRLSNKATLPNSNYLTRGLMHWLEGW
jgi:hypothetical protein